MNSIEKLGEQYDVKVIKRKEANTAGDKKTVYRLSGFLANIEAMKRALPRYSDFCGDLQTICRNY